MPITVRCQCGKRVVFKDEQAGKRGKCPACHETFLIQRGNKAAEAAAVEEIEDVRKIDEVDDEEEVSEQRKKSSKKRKRKQRKPIHFNIRNFTCFGLFGDFKILGMTPGCLLVGIAILVSGGLAVYYTVPGLGPVMCYKATEMRDDAFTASYEVRVIIYNAPQGAIEETLTTGFVMTDELSGRRKVRSRENVRVTKHVTQGSYTIEWSEDRGVYAVTFNGKKVPRSIFSTSGQSR